MDLDQPIPKKKAAAAASQPTEKKKRGSTKRKKSTGSSSNVDLSKLLPFVSRANLEGIITASIRNDLPPNVADIISTLPESDRWRFTSSGQQKKKWKGVESGPERVNTGLFNEIDNNTMANIMRYLPSKDCHTAEKQKRIEHHKGVAKKEMTEAEIACKPLTSFEKRCPTSYDFRKVREYSNDRIKLGLNNKEWNAQELSAICSTRSLKPDGAKGTLTTRLHEYVDEDIQKGGEWTKKNMKNETILFKIVAAAIGRENANVWVKKVNVPVRNHMVNALVFPPTKEGISTMARIWEELLGNKRVEYGGVGPYATGSSASQLKALLTQNCNLQHHESSRNGNQGRKDDTNWDNATMQVFWSDYLHEGGVHPQIGSLPKMGKELEPLNRGKKGKGISNQSQWKAGAAGGGKKASKVDNRHAASLMEEEMESATDKDDKRASRAAKRAKKKLEADAMPEEDGEPAAKENESSGGKKRKATGGGEKKKKKDPNAPKNKRSAMRPSLKEENPDMSFGDRQKLMSALWKDLEDKSEYKRQEEEDKARHAREMQDYNPPPEEDDDASLEEDGGRPAKRSRRANVNYDTKGAIGKPPAKGKYNASHLKLGKVVTFDDAEYDNQLARVYKEPCSKDKQVQLQLIDEEGIVMEEVEEGDSIVHVEIEDIVEVEKDPESDDKPEEEVELSPYEKQRLEKIARNKERLKSLGLDEAGKKKNGLA